MVAYSNSNDDASANLIHLAVASWRCYIFMPDIVIGDHFVHRMLFYYTEATTFISAKLIILSALATPIRSLELNIMLLLTLVQTFVSYLGAWILHHRRYVSMILFFKLYSPATGNTPHVSPMPRQHLSRGISRQNTTCFYYCCFFKHLDFVRLESDAIKELFWTNRHQKKHGEFIPPPKALQRDVKTIKNFLKSGNQQKNQEIAKYKQFDEQLIKESNDVWHVSDITAACKTMDTEPTSCKGITFQDIEESTKLTQERRKDEIKIGMCQLIRQGFSNKYKQTGSNDRSYCVPITITGAVVKGARNEVAWLVVRTPYLMLFVQWNIVLILQFTSGGMVQLLLEMKRV
eukprot:scaffold55789_cov58-Cyclotella_meneghiniana.AAC.1